MVLDLTPQDVVYAVYEAKMLYVWCGHVFCQDSGQWIVLFYDKHFDNFS